MKMVQLAIDRATQLPFRFAYGPLRVATGTMGYKQPNPEVGATHPKAMPVILTTPDEVETWMTAPSR
jgi:acetoacetate decarboxylase